MMKISKQCNRPKNLLGRVMGHLMAACLVLGFGFAELSAQDLANFVNTIIQDGEPTVTDDITVDPGETFTLEISVEAGDLEVNNVTVSMMYDPAVLTANSATDLAGGLLPIPLGGAVPLITVMDMGGVPMGQVRWAKGDLFGNPPTGTFGFLSINFTANADIDVNTMTEIFHLTDNVAESLIIQPAVDGVAADITGEIPSVNVFVDAGVAAFDCPDLMADFGDECDDNDDTTEDDIVVDNGDGTCSCQGTPIQFFDCPALEANIGDACDDEDDDTENDAVNADCVCVGTPIVEVFDCPELEANIGDACDDEDDDTENDAVNADCVCMGTPIQFFDCPALEANIGDDCDDDNDDTENDTVNADCVCMGTTIVEVFDCPELEANFGDDCNDENDDTENDVVGTDCVCMGTLIEFDCPELGLNIGDACDDLDPNTENDVVGSECGCAGTIIVIDDCNNYVYYLADHTFPEDISDLYRVDIVDGNAELTYIATCPDEVHIAFNEANGLVYAIRKDDGALKSIDPTADTPVYSEALAVDASFSQITQAVFSQDGKLLVSSANQDITYSIDVMNSNAVTVFDSYSPVEGGDLAYAIDGSALYMATREGNGGLYSVMMEGVGPDVFIAPLPPNVTGMATMESGNLLISANGNSSLLVKSTAGADVAALPLTLNGEPFTLNDGDMASGCAGNVPVVTTGCNGGSVFEFLPGPKKNGQPITDPERTDPAKALGAPQINNTLNFVSLGFGGSIALGFDGGSAFNGPGDDILVVETTYGNIAGLESDFSTYPESAEVFVSQDEVNYFSVGTVFTDQAATFEIDDAGQGFTFITSVKIVDNTPLSSISGDAFDLDGISALNGCGTAEEEPENAGLVSTITSYPNPTPGNSQVVFVAAGTSRTMVEVYDMNGRNVATLFNQVAEKGLEYRLDFNGAALPNGVYIYRMTNNNETLINKFMIAK